MRPILTDFFCMGGTLALTNSFRMTANISRILAAGSGPVLRSARAPPEARAFPIPRTVAGLKRQFWNENAVRAFAINYGQLPQGSRQRQRRTVMNNIIWLVGAVVIVIAILSFLGLR
ncbi:hypothetical protein ABID19_000415 [Mesorhizobium robiniae]|uniref:Uncharacterized protein n=1 Tax=Mesorhizobium robiniae TaxID=559315 RepID=A0ABV2GGI9_9HYPH